MIYVNITITYNTIYTYHRHIYIYIYTYTSPPLKHKKCPPTKTALENPEIHSGNFEDLSKIPGSATALEIGEATVPADEPDEPDEPDLMSVLTPRSNPSDENPSVEFLDSQDVFFLLKGVEDDVFFAKSHFEDEIFPQICGSNLVTLSDLRRIWGKK